MAVILVLIFSATVRLYELQRPNALVFDETYYAKDAHTVLHGYLGPNPLYSWEPGKEISWPHPEYGKFAIAVGILLFGDRSFGWRLPAVIAGIGLGDELVDGGHGLAAEPTANRRRRAGAAEAGAGRAHYAGAAPVAGAG